MPKTYAQINEKIKRGEAVVVTAEEMIDVVEEKGAAKAAEEVDVVTTSTSRAAFATPFSSTISISSSAVTTTALPCLIFSLISW